MHGANNIINHFKTIYENLYNEQQDISQTLVDDITNGVTENIDNSKETIGFFSPDLVKAVIKKLKLTSLMLVEISPLIVLSQLQPSFMIIWLHYSAAFSSMGTFVMTYWSVL